MKKDKKQSTYTKKITIEKHEPHQKPGVNIGAPEEKAQHWIETWRHVFGQKVQLQLQLQPRSNSEGRLFLLYWWHPSCYSSGWVSNFCITRATCTRRVTNCVKLYFCTFSFGGWLGVRFFFYFSCWQWNVMVACTVVKNQ